MIKALPILFNAPMVRAILDGRKTETRRVLHRNRSYPYGKTGDYLWVRETFAFAEDGDPPGWVYRATDPEWETTFGWRWKPSIFMPREASRITLQITALHIEPLLAITEAAAIREGVEQWPDGNYKSYCKYGGKSTRARDSYLSLWDAIHGDNAHQLNRDVWVIQFKVIRD